MSPIKRMKRRLGVEHRPSKWQVGAVVFCLILSLFAGMAINERITGDTWSPLGPYPEQIVTSQGPKVDSPSSANAVVAQIKLGSKVHVKERKTVDEDVDILGSGPDWVSDFPPGFIHEGPRTRDSQRLEGTTNFDFENDIPPAVDKWARGVIASGGVPEVHLSGCETPIDGNKTGEPLCWRTQKFVLVLP